MECDMYLGTILCIGSGNEIWRYIATSSLIGWAQTQHYPWDLSAELFGWKFDNPRKEQNSMCYKAGKSK